MSKNVQNELFDLSEIKQAEVFRPRKYWYYVTTPMSTQMVAGLASDGSPIYAPHDTRPEVGIKPHLFNTRGGAKRYQNKYVKGGHCKTWQYSHK